MNGYIHACDIYTYTYHTCRRTDIRLHVCNIYMYIYIGIYININNTYIHTCTYIYVHIYKVFVKDSMSKRKKCRLYLFRFLPCLHFLADLVTFTEEILNLKFHFLCNDCYYHLLLFLCQNNEK